MQEKPQIAIIMGSDSDLELAKKTIETLKQFEVPYIVKILSAHRTPTETKDFIINSNDNGVKVYIAIAGKAAHLPGVIASYTTSPVIGVAVKSSDLGGIDALLSIVQMPSGIPVAAVAIDGAQNAALLAIQMLSISDSNLKIKMQNYRKDMAKKIIKKDKDIQNML